MAGRNNGITQLASGSYRWRVMVDGRRLTGTESTLESARRARLEAQLRAGAEAPSEASVAELVAMWKAQVEHAHSTAQVRDAALDLVPATFLQRSAREVTAPVVAALWREMLADGVGAGTVTKARNALSRAFELGVEWGIVTGNPIRAVKPRMPAASREVRPPSPAEVRRLIEYFADRPPYPVWIRFMAVTGARPGEVCGLQWDDVDVDRGVVRISRSIDRWGNVTPGKNGRSGHRDVPLDLPTLTALRRVERVVGSPWVFTRSGRRPWRPDGVGLEIRRAVSADNLSISMRPYDLRHFAASQALAAGRPVPEVAHMLGDNPATVMRVYAHFIGGDSLSASAVAAALDGA